jgi:hypothetical protein
MLLEPNLHQRIGEKEQKGEVSTQTQKKHYTKTNKHSPCRLQQQGPIESNPAFKEGVETNAAGMDLLLRRLGETIVPNNNKHNSRILATKVDITYFSRWLCSIARTLTHTTSNHNTRKR